VESPVPCLVCGGCSAPAFSWDRNSAAKSFKQWFGVQPPSDALPCDYTNYQCSVCQLEFALPPIPGNNIFYDWVITLPSYYSDYRWEWGIVAEQLAGKAPGKPIKLLDAGCGSGNFLNFIKSKTGAEGLGLDTSPTAIAACRSRGIPGLVCEPTEYLADHKKVFDAICGFHSLEHVPDPSKFLSGLAAGLTEGGRLFISVPLSPIKNEIHERHALNMPPHHLTRWNVQSLQRLADVCGLDVAMLSRDDFGDSGIVRSSLYLLVWHWPNLKAGGWGGILAHIVRHPGSFLRTVKYVLRREVIAGRRGGDTVLCAFSPHRG
jgi:SAM-dependent methyltransferase